MTQQINYGLIKYNITHNGVTTYTDPFKKDRQVSNGYTLYANNNSLLWNTPNNQNNIVSVPYSIGGDTTKSFEFKRSKEYDLDIRNYYDRSDTLDKETDLLKFKNHFPLEATLKLKETENYINDTNLRMYKGSLFTTKNNIMFILMQESNESIVDNNALSTYFRFKLIELERLNPRNIYVIQQYQFLGVL